ncbi:MAG TPA: hypothetical protein VF609_16490 [Flavisolibacter sp.]|jgi:hypothetical protein
MKRYSILRHNQESGPFTLSQLKSFGITDTDLVWIEGESTSWDYPTEITELKVIVKPSLKPSQTMAPTAAQASAKANTELQQSGLSAGTNYVASPSETENSFDQYFAATKEEFNWNTKKQRLNFSSITANLFGMGVLLIGVMMCAFVVKKLVDHFEFEPEVASSEAIEISSGNSLVNVTSNAAKATNTSLLAPMSLGIAVGKNDSLQAERLKAEKAPVQTKVAIAQTSPAETEENPASLAQEKQETIADTGEAKATEEKETKADTEPGVKRAPSLNVSANDYKVGMFGGISELELTITNPSSVTVEKAIVEVDFLKPNGSVIKTQTLSVENISPGGEKKLAVPSSSRGVKVRYRVMAGDNR